MLRANRGPPRRHLRSTLRLVGVTLLVRSGFSRNRVLYETLVEVLSASGALVVRHWDWESLGTAPPVLRPGERAARFRLSGGLSGQHRAEDLRTSDAREDSTG